MLYNYSSLLLTSFQNKYLCQQKLCHLTLFWSLLQYPKFIPVVQIATIRYTSYTVSCFGQIHYQNQTGLYCFIFLNKMHWIPNYNLKAGPINSISNDTSRTNRKWVQYCWTSHILSFYWSERHFLGMFWDLNLWSQVFFLRAIHTVKPLSPLVTKSWCEKTKPAAPVALKYCTAMKSVETCKVFSEIPNACSRY